MKRNCNNCKALNTTFHARCDLGYKIEVLKEIDHISVSYKPLEECEKPLTYSDLIYIKSIKSKQTITK